MKYAVGAPVIYDGRRGVVERITLGAYAVRLPHAPLVVGIPERELSPAAPLDAGAPNVERIREYMRGLHDPTSMSDSELSCGEVQDLITHIDKLEKIDERAIEWGLDGGVPPEWVIAAALNLFFAADVNEQVIAVEAVADLVRADADND